MKTIIKLLALGALAGVVISGISAAAASVSQEEPASVDYSRLTFDFADKVLEKMEPKTFESSDGTALNYRIYYSPGYSPADTSNPAMLFVFLHGSGGRGDDNAMQIKDQVATVNYLVSDSAATLLGDVPYVVIAPQCPNGTQWVNSPWANGSYSIDDVEISPHLNAVYELIKNTIENDNVNDGNVFLGGISMGGFGTWDLALRHPELFNAIFPICGSGDPSKAAALKDVKVWTFHSDNDASVPVQSTRDMVAALETAGVDVRYTEFTGKGHNAWKPAMEEVTDPYLLEWLIESCRTYNVRVITTEGENTEETVEKLCLGDSFVLDFTPDAGFVPQKITVNGEEAEFITDDTGNLRYEGTVTGNMEINAVFAAEEESSEESSASVATNQKGGLSRNAKIGIAAGAALIVAAGVAAIIIGKKKKKQ